MIEIIDQFSGSSFFRIKTQQDHRGNFAKFFQSSEFAKLGWPTQWKEQYASTSLPGVVRGLHFQLPPHEHDKLVFVLSGGVFDVGLDLRRSSSSFQKAKGVELKAGEGVFLPKGFAHGFCVTSREPATLLYLVTSEYQASHDTGILWDSINVDWPVCDAIISSRDKTFVPLDEFASPF